MRYRRLPTFWRLVDKANHYALAGGEVPIPLLRAFVELGELEATPKIRKAPQRSPNRSHLSKPKCPNMLRIAREAKRARLVDEIKARGNIRDAAVALGVSLAQAYRLVRI